MANLTNIKDNRGWLANRIAIDCHAIYMIFGDSGPFTVSLLIFRCHGLESVGFMRKMV